MGLGLVELVELDQLPGAREVFNQTEVKYQALLAHLNTSYALCRVVKSQDSKPSGYVFLEINPAFELQLGVSQADVIGRDINDTIIGGGYMGLDWTSLLAATAQDGMPRVFEQQAAVLRRWFRITVFCPLEDQVAVLLADITQQKEKQQQVVYPDSRIGWSSQRLLEDRLMLAIIQAKRSREQLAVAIFDVDNVAALVETYGYEVGNELVQEIGRRTETCLRQSDTVARVGMATFVLILPSVKTKNFAVMVANRVLEQCRRPLLLRDTVAIPSGTISLCFFPDDQSNFAETVSKEDVSMYLSKKRKFPQVCLTF